MDYKLVPISVIKVQKLQASIERKMKAEGKLLDPPTYTVELLGGTTQTHPHDEVSIADPSTSDEEKQAWEQYLIDIEEFNDTFTEVSTNLLLYDGVSCEIGEDWIEEQKWIGIDVPENKYDLKVHYLQTEVFKTPLELREVIADIMIASMKGVDQDAVDAAMRSFRSEPENGEGQLDSDREASGMGNP